MPKSKKKPQMFLEVSQRTDIHDTPAAELQFTFGL